MNGKKFLASFLSAAMICSQFSALTPKASAKPLGPGAKSAIAGFGGGAAGAVIFGVPLLLKVLTSKSYEQPTRCGWSLRECCKRASGEGEYPGLGATFIFNLLSIYPDCVAVCYSGKDGLKHLIEDSNKLQQECSLKALSDSAEIVFKTDEGKYMCKNESEYSRGKTKLGVDPNNVCWFFEDDGKYCWVRHIRFVESDKINIEFINGYSDCIFKISITRDDMSWSYFDGHSDQPLEWSDKMRGFAPKNS